MSHLAVLARLELLHESTLLRLSGRPERSSDIHESIDHPDSILPPTEGTDQLTAGEAWDEVASLLKVLGDGLREESLRIPLGKTSLCSTLADLFRFALDSPSTTSFDHLPSPLPGCPQGKKSQAIVEICRVAGNLCFDCDENRSILLEYSFPQALIVLIASITTNIDLSVDLAKSALGALLNISLDHDQIQNAILSMEGALEILLKAANMCYLPDPVKADSSADNIELRRAISGWAWRVVGEISLLESAPAILSTQSETLLPHLALPILTYLPPSSSPVPFEPDDILILTTATQIIEANTLDSESWQHALANSRASRSSLSSDSSSINGPWIIQQKRKKPENEGIAVWSLILDFIESVCIVSKEEIADMGDSQDVEEEEEREEENLSLGSIKGGLIKSIVAVAGSDELAESLFEESDRSGFLSRMKSFLSEHGNQKDREDLIICAVLSLGNLARSDERCASLLGTSSSILPSILPFMVPTTDIKIQHGLVGLLKNLAVSDQNKPILGDAGLIDKMIGMKCLQPERDTVGSVQGGAIGVIKNLAKGNCSNSLRVLLPSSSTDEAALSPILALNARSDDFSLQAESARVLVNVIRTLLSSPHTITPEPKRGSDPDASTDDSEQMRLAREVLIERREDITRALIGLVNGGIQKKYEVLCAEGVMALAMLAGSSEVVAKTIATALLKPTSSSSLLARPSFAANSSASSPTATSPVALTSASGEPATLLVGLAALLSLPSQPQLSSSGAFTISPALKGNVSSLLAVSGRALAFEVDSEADAREQFGRALKGMTMEDMTGGMADVKEKALKILYC